MMSRAAASANCQYLSICGDFNLPLVDWSINSTLESETAYSSEFVRCAVEELSLFQHVNLNTRFRGEQSSCLDPIFMNEEGMVNEIRELPPIGKSDHICKEWEVIIREPMFRNTSVLRPNFKRAKWADLKADLRGFANEPENQPSEMYDEFVTMINNVRDRHIPKCKPKTNRHRLPWMKAPKIKKQRVTQWRSWKRYKQTGSVVDYDAYKMERNRLVDCIRSAKIRHEQRLIEDMKHNPNLYHGHCRRTLKTKQGVTNVVNKNGVLTESEGETAESLNEYYHSVLTRDDGVQPPPEFPVRTEEKITDVQFRTEAVRDRLLELNPNKAAGPDGVESRLMKECAEELAPVLHQIYRKLLDEGRNAGKMERGGNSSDPQRGI